jgi:ribosomal protein S18 acetylase RimI-like enzyme
VIAATDLFPPDLLDGMTEGFFAGTPEAGFWLTLEGASPVALAYCAPERMTEGTWNLLLIAVHPHHQAQGLGAALVRAVEGALLARGARLLLVETSGLPAYVRTRAFYPRCGFTEEARIRDFYQDGEDKIVFRKRLVPPAAQ